MVKKLLIVDDENFIRETFLDFLKEFGYNAFSASNGSDALEMTKHEKFDLIITDIHMPKMNGIDFFYALKDENDLPYIIIMTGFYNELDEDKLIDDGVYKILKKPVDFFDLKSLIEKM
jgi:CheY-like chemotaxis protein